MLIDTKKRNSIYEVLVVSMDIIELRMQKYVLTREGQKSRGRLILTRPAIGFVKGMFSQKIVLKASGKQWRNSNGR